MSSPIKEFPKDGQPWRIEWIGQIFQDKYDKNEIKVRVHISRLKPSSPKNTALNNTSLVGYEEKIYDQHHYDLPIGFIHRLKIGSVWINTEEQLDYRAVEETIEIAAPSTLRLLTLTDEGYEKTEDGEWRPTLSNRQYRVALRARYGTSVVMIYGHPKYKQILIPSPVIFQSCYVTSPKAASKLLFGQLDELIDESDSGYVEGKENTYRVHLHQDYKDVEGVMLAHFLLDQTAQRNLKLLNRVNRLEAVASDQPILAIKIGFPFSSRIKLKVLGKEISYPADGKTRMQKESGFFVTQILSVKTQFPFDKLLPARKNDASKGDILADNPKGSWGGVTPQSSDSDEQSLTDDKVSAHHEDTKIDLPDIVDLMGVEILKRESKKFQNYISKPFTPHGSIQAVRTGVSSGEKKQITVGASQLNTTSTHVNLDAIFEVLKHLRNHNLDVQELAILNAERSDKGIVNFFPYKYIPGRRWHRKEDDSGGRAFVIAQLYLAGQFYYLIDIEARGSDRLSIGLVSKRNHMAITAEEFRELMRMVVIKNGWKAFTENYVKSLAFKRVNHDHNKNDFANIAKNILKVLNH